MNYYRKIEKSVNDLKYKFQIAALNLKINENKNDIKSLKDTIIYQKLIIILQVI